MTINQYEIDTSMGRGNAGQWEQIGFLTAEDIQILNDIGYGSNKQFTRAGYLNSKYAGKYMFDIKQTEYDGGDFSESFNVVVVKL